MDLKYFNGWSSYHSFFFCCSLLKSVYQACKTQEKKVLINNNPKVLAFSSLFFATLDFFLHIKNAYSFILLFFLVQRSSNFFFFLLGRIFGSKKNKLREEMWIYNVKWMEYNSWCLIVYTWNFVRVEFLWLWLNGGVKIC